MDGSRRYESEEKNLRAELVVGVVGVAGEGVAEEEGAVEGLGGGDLDGGAGGAELLGEGAAVLGQGGQGAGGGAVKGERLDVDGEVAVVLDVGVAGLLGRDGGGEQGGGRGEDGGVLHGDGWWWLSRVVE